MTPSPRQHGHTGQRTWGLGLRGRGLMGRAGSMDTLFVEEVAASLVREFLSRKVRGAASTALSSGSNLEGRPVCRVPLQPLHLWGGRSSPTRRFPDRELLGKSATLPGWENYISQEPFLSPCTFRRAGQDRGGPPRTSHLLVDLRAKEAA